MSGWRPLPSPPEAALEAGPVRPRAVLHVLTALLILGAGRAFAATEPTIPVQEFTLPNGLRVFLSEDHRAPQVTVNIWYHVGAANQEPGRSGFAHLFEHMMFSGSQHVPDSERVLASIGVDLGSAANGGTSFDQTIYFETVGGQDALRVRHVLA